MSLASLGIADKSFELGKSVLTVACLGIFSKLLRIDLSNLQILGVSFGAQSTGLVPGFLGLALIYAYCCLMVARLESVLDIVSRKDLQEQLEKASESGPVIGAMLVAMPLVTVVYVGPFAIGAFAIYLLWPETIVVIQSIWALANT